MERAIRRSASSALIVHSENVRSPKLDFRMAQFPIRAMPPIYPKAQLWQVENCSHQMSRHFSTDIIALGTKEPVPDNGQPGFARKAGSQDWSSHVCIKPFNHLVRMLEEIVVAIEAPAQTRLVGHFSSR